MEFGDEGLRVREEGVMHVQKEKQVILFSRAQSVCDHIDRIARDFVWKGSQDRGIHLVGWNTITKNRQCGGLGIRVARDMISAMLGKLIGTCMLGRKNFGSDCSLTNMLKIALFCRSKKSMALMLGILS